MDDRIYYRDAGSIAAARGVSARARLNIYQLFVRELAPGPSCRILDLGVSTEEGPEANMLEKQYPWPHNITCAGLGDGEALQRIYPGISYVKVAPGGPLPFDSAEFDIVHSNAVLEHVGGRADRAAFLREAARVGRSLFITIPNRWFPLEHHTAIPLLHWNPTLFRAFTKKTSLSYWSDPRNVDFIGARDLMSEWRRVGQTAGEVRFVGLRLGPLSSNLALIVKRAS